jgi:hypothetical protein
MQQWGVVELIDMQTAGTSVCTLTLTEWPATCPLPSQCISFLTVWFEIHVFVCDVYTIYQQMHYSDDLLIPSTAPKCFDLCTSSSRNFLLCVLLSYITNTRWHKKNGNFWKTQQKFKKSNKILWRQHAVDRSTDPWLLNGVVVCSSWSLFRSAANCTWLPLRISKVPVFCVTLYNIYSLWCVPNVFTFSGCN